VTPPTPPAPAAPAAAAPTASITAEPNVILKGAATTLTWETTGATDVTVSGLGSVPVRNSRVVSPTESTTFTITAKGPGGSVEASARVTVNAPPPGTTLPPDLTIEQLFAQDIRDIYFGYDTYDIASGESANVTQDAEFLTRYPNVKIVIAGHCDERGSEEYNLALGQSRAESLKDALVTAGVSANRIRIISLGKEKPFCTEEDEACWQKNRVDHLTMDGK